MKIPKNEKQFESCPPFEGRAVCVDVTPLERRETKFGPKEQFKVVFEVDKLRSDGTPFCVWSKWFTPSSHEKSAFRAFLKDWFGRDMSESEWELFDTEDLIGRPGRIIVVNERDGDDVYANIKLLLPHKDGEPLKPSGKFIRKKDRQETNGDYRKTQAPEEPANDTDPDAWTKIKVHVGKFKGHELRELDPDTSVKALVEHWLPTAKANPKPTADDRRLMFALEKFLEWQRANAAEKAADDLPY